jgi:hypothetical protein
MNTFFDKINWPLLAGQKLSLLECITVAPTREHAEHLQGILHMIDDLQDMAEAAGYNVVWLTEK